VICQPSSLSSHIIFSADSQFGANSAPLLRKNATLLTAHCARIEFTHSGQPDALLHRSPRQPGSAPWLFIPMSAHIETLIIPILSTLVR
jgi:hypothetical protein